MLVAAPVLTRAYTKGGREAALIISSSDSRHVAVVNQTVSRPLYSLGCKQRLPSRVTIGFSLLIIRRRVATCLPCGLSCVFSGNPVRAKSLRGMKRPRRHDLKRHGGNAGDKSLHHVKSEIGSKILPHDPASFFAKAPPGSRGLT
jgi:hypothetical protein